MFGGPPTAEELAETARMRALTPRSRPPSPGLFGKPFGSDLHEENIAPKLFENKFPGHSIERANLIPLSQLKSINGTFNYVVNEYGKLIVGRASKLPGGGHVDLSGGGFVQAAGEFKVIDGQIKYIDNASGHYLPVGRSAQLVAENAFRNLGFNIAGVYVEKTWFDDPTMLFGGVWRPKL